MRVGYWIVLVSNGIYVPIAVAHFMQHLNHDEVDWAHAGLAITNLVAAAGVLFVTFHWLRHLKDAKVRRDHEMA